MKKAGAVALIVYLLVIVIPFNARGNGGDNMPYWDFNSVRGTAVWFIYHQECNVYLELKDGLLIATATNDDPYFFLGTSSQAWWEPFDGRTYNRIYTRLRANRDTILSVYYMTAESPFWSQDKSQRFPVKAGSDFQDMVLQMEGIWLNSEIINIRIGPGQKKGDRIEFDYISLAGPLKEEKKEKPAPGKEWDSKVEDYKKNTSISFHSTGPFSVSSEGFIRDWLLCGPLPASRDDIGYDWDYFKNFGGEAHITARMEDKIVIGFPETSGGLWKPGMAELVWKPYSTSDNLINMGEVLGFPPMNIYIPPQEVVGYAFCWIEAEKEEDAILSIGSDDGFKIWLNEEFIGGKNELRAASKDQDLFNVRLKKGFNSVLVKITQKKGGMGFYLRFLNGQQQPLTDIKVWY